MSEKVVILDENGIKRAINRISYEILERNKDIENILIVGIYTRGAILAKRIYERLKEIEKKDIKLGFIDIANHRDDVKPLPNYKSKTNLSDDINGKRVILIDDVIYTGRTVRAAIDAIMELGRPESIQLAVLIDRGHRDLPIKADFVGKNLPTSKNQKVSVMLYESDNIDKVVIIQGES